MDNYSLRIKQAEFEGTRQELEKDLIKLEAKRIEFIKLFPIEKLSFLKIEKYALQKGKDESKKSFCYWLENELKDLGNIHGSTAHKFGIYFGKTKTDSTLKYRFTLRFGNSEIEAFENIKSSIISLLKSAEQNNLEEIRYNKISPMVKGKILSTYFPNNFLNIFDNNHLENFLDKLEIAYENSDDEIYKRQSLIDFKNKDSIMLKWSIYEFSKFLYVSYGPPANKRKAPAELKEYLESKKDYPKINKVTANYIDLDIILGHTENTTKSNQTQNHFSKLIDFELENKINKLLGNRGEEIVFNKEKEYLTSIGKIELVKNVEWVSKKDDSLGYDILSYDKDGRKKYIEVKSTNRSPDSKPNFLISSNQYKKAKELENYYFYVVFNTKTTNPKIWKLQNPLSYENNGLTLTPISYRVMINTNLL
jgi:hypothetical protein